MKAQLTKKAIAKRQAAATHKLVVTNEFGQVLVAATGSESDMQAIMKVTSKTLAPQIVTV